MSLDAFWNSEFFRLTTTRESFSERIDDVDVWCRFAERYDQWRQTKNILSRCIPHLIHQIWLGGELPYKYKKCCNSWRSFNPNYEYRLWDEQSILNLGYFESRTAFIKSVSLGVKSDIARYEILRRFGGIYADTDFECLRPFDDLLDRCSLVVGNLYGYKPEICNAFIASVPDHPVINELCARTNRIVKTTEPLEVIDATGPGLLTREIVQALPRLEVTDVILPSVYLYPFPYYCKDMEIIPDAKSYLTHESYGVHYWDVSWNRLNIIAWIARKGHRGIKRIKHIVSCIFHHEDTGN